MSTVNQNAERIVKGMKRRSASRFRRLYGKRAKEVMYATANKLAQKEQVKMGPTHNEVFSEAPKYDKQGNDKYDRSKRMIRHKQKKYGVSTFMQRLKTGADHNIDNEKKMKKEETINERGDFWHPDPDKDRKLGGPGANQRAREDRGASKPAAKKEDPKKLRPGESYMQYAKRMKTRKEDVQLDEKKKGLWANIHAKRKRGERPARPGEKDYPKTLNVESNGLKTFKQFVEGAAWTKKSGKSESGGLNEKGRKSYERENPGSDLKAPSKKVGNPRRASFCARMKGMKSKLTSKKTASDPDSRINKSLRAWNC
jgi:hypothetical protein